MAGLGRATWSKAAAHRRRDGGDRRRWSRWRSCAASRAAGGRPAALLVVAYGVDDDLALPDRDRPGLQQVRQAAAGPAAHARCSSWPTGPGVDVGQVYRVDASRRTSAANAYVIGLGHTKRVVLYDNLIDDFTARRGAHGGRARARPPEARRPAARARLARDRGAGRHVPRAGRWPSAFARRGGSARRPALPAIALAIALVSLGLGCASNVLSRQVEASADSFSLRLTRDPADFIGFQRRISIQNIADPDPPAVWPGPVRDPPDDGRADRRRRGVRVQVGCRRSCPAVRHRAGDPRAGLVRARARRPTGERRAAEWLAGELRAAGCRDVRVEEERAHGGYWWPLGLLNAASALAALLGPPARGAGGRRGRGGGLRRRERRQALVSPPRAAAPPDLERRGRAGRPRTRRGRSSSSPTTTPPTAASCSTRRCRGSAMELHAEAARARPNQSIPIIFGVFLGPLLLALWGLTRPAPAAPGRHSSSPAAPPPRWRTSARSRVVPGANDNLSAVGVLVALAHELRERPPAGVRVLLALDRLRGGLHGGDAGVRPPPLRRARPRGRPSSSASSASARRSCAWSRRRACCACATTPSPHARRWRGRARRPASSSRRGLRTVAATDALIALRAGYPTCTLGGVDETKFPSNYHWPSDTPDNLDWSSIEGAVRGLRCATCGG